MDLPVTTEWGRFENENAANPGPGGPRQKGVHLCHGVLLGEVADHRCGNENARCGQRQRGG